MTCPNCAQPMTEQVLDGHLGTSVTIDLCLACQAFWFDDREHLALSPGSILKLFRLIGERAATGRPPASSTCACPRCGMRLVPVHDLQRRTRFQYQRCPLRHGRLISFFDFLREKDFIRPMSADQIAELRRNVQTVNCSNCGAPIDLTATTTCVHCGSPLSMIDMAQAGDLVSQLQQADQGKATVDPALPMRLERARREVAASFAAFEQEPAWYDDVKATDMVGAGLSAIARWLKR
jgi:hypothetical protein